MTSLPRLLRGAGGEEKEVGRIEDESSEGGLKGCKKRGEGREEDCVGGDRLAKHGCKREGGKEGS